MMKLLAKAWEFVREVYFFLKPIRFVVVPLVLLLFALVLQSQGQDSIRFLVEVDPRCPAYGRIAVFLLLVCATALQVWYWSRQMLRIDSVSETAARHPKSEQWMPRLLGASVFLIAILALGWAFYLGWSGQFDFTARVIVVTAGILLVLMALFLAFVILRRRRIPASQRVTTYRGFAATTIWLLRITIFLALVFVVWTAISPLTAGYVFQSPALLMLSVALWCGIGTALAYWFDGNRVPLASTFLIAAVVFSCCNDNHAVRTLDGQVPERKSVDDTFTDWYDRLAKNPSYATETTHPVFIVATEGGGIRAAYWTAAVLTAIQDQAPQFS